MYLLQKIFPPFQVIAILTCNTNMQNQNVIIIIITIIVFAFFKKIEVNKC